MSKNTIKIGDVVRITTKVTEEAGWNNVWDDSMDRHIGKSAVVTYINQCGVVLEDVPFSWPPSALELVQDEPAKPAYEFKVGDKGKTKEGIDYEVIAINSALDQPLVVVVQGELEQYELDGHYFSDCSDDCDLLPPKKECTIFVNVYEDSVNAHADKESAERRANKRTALHIALPVTFELPA